MEQKGQPVGEIDLLAWKMRCSAVQVRWSCTDGGCSACLMCWSWITLGIILSKGDSYFVSILKDEEQSSWKTKQIDRWKDRSFGLGPETFLFTFHLSRGFSCFVCFACLVGFDEERGGGQMFCHWCNVSPARQRWQVPSHISWVSLQREMPDEYRHATVSVHGGTGYSALRTPYSVAPYQETMVRG